MKTFFYIFETGTIEGAFESNINTIFSSRLIERHFLYIFASHHTPLAPIELRAQTSGVPFTHASWLSCFAFCSSVAFHAKAISAHPRVMGNCFRVSRDPDHFKLLIFHKEGVDRPLTRQRGLSPSQCQHQEQSSVTQLSHA